MTSRLRGRNAPSVEAAMGTGTGAIDEAMMRERVCGDCLTQTRLEPAHGGRPAKEIPTVSIPAKDEPWQFEEPSLERSSGRATEVRHAGVVRAGSQGDGGGGGDALPRA